MSALPAPRRFRHEAAIYGSDEELLATAVPFLRAGREAGEPTFVGVDGPEQQLILDALGGTEGITPLAHGDVYADPVAALQQNRRMLHEAVSRAPSRVRVLGEVPSHGVANDWHGWARYEAAINHIFGPLDVWSVCPYDTRVTPDHVLADVERTHTHLAVGGAFGDANPAYADPATFLADHARREADPLEATTPHAAQREPTPAAARAMVAALGAATALPTPVVDHFLLAVSEVVTNAIVHGEAPVDVRAWAGDDRLVVTVHDRGPGPADPFAGFLPRGDGPGGLGLWMTNQACSRLAMSRGPDGFTVRLTAGTPPDPRRNHTAP